MDDFYQRYIYGLLQKQRKFKFLYGRFLLIAFMITLAFKIVQIPLWTIFTEIADICRDTHFKVQIPLWTIFTDSVYDYPSVSLLRKYNKPQ